MRKNKLGGLCPGGGGLYPRGCFSLGISVRGGGGFLSEGSLSRRLSRRVSVQGVSLSRRDLCPGGLCLRGASVQDWGSLSGCGLCPEGVSLYRMDFCPGGFCRGVSAQWRFCLGGSLSGRHPLPYGNERAVHMLLECILV